MELLEDSHFMGQEGERAFFMISATSGRDISQLSLEPQQEEARTRSCPGLSCGCGAHHAAALVSRAAAARTT